ncbi:MAG: acetate--CoA ligase family protein [Acidobacteria bacterium]|nr:acetate--CoA ligase family protein [Acidobacteriota bacterium]
MPNARSLDPIFRPRSVAVIGASRDKSSIGREILHNLLEGDYNGPIFPVNPRSPMVHSLKSYPSVLDIPDPVDLAVVVVRRDLVLDTVEECGRKGVKGLVVITAGFKEAGEEGGRLEAKLRDKVRHHGMRMIGPNCMGVINTESRISLNATFARAKPLPGKIGFVSQSGALGEAILAHAREMGLGVSMFASVGNKTDISGNDLLEYWADDDSVSLILLYLESFGNPRKFRQLAQRITRTKPILAVKAGRSAAGARAAGTHTGALAGLDVAVETLLDQCGVLRASTIQEMFVFAQALATQPLPRGKRVAVVTNAGGPGILAADALENLGMSLPPLAPASLDALRAVLPPEATPANPIDLIASARDDRYRAAVKIAAGDPNVDALLVIFVSPIMIDAHSVAVAIVEATRGTDKPVAMCFMGKLGQEEGRKVFDAAGIPVYVFPELAAVGLASMERCRALRAREAGNVVALDLDGAAASGILAGARAAGRRDLSLVESLDLLDAAGIPTAARRVVASEAEAIAFGLDAGYPIVLKVVATALSHKTEAGGVRVDLRNGDEAGAAYRKMAKDLARFGEGSRILAQKMTAGREVIFGVTHDSQFGPLAMFGLGGVYVEVLKDVTFKILPLTDREAGDMVRGVRGFPILAGVRGEKPVDLAVLEEMLLRLSRLISDHPSIEALDVNPFFAAETRGASAAVDARVRLKEIEETRP